MPAVRRRRRQRGGLGPFGQQLAMFSLAPIITDLASNVLGSVLPGLTGQGGGKFSLPGNSQMIGLPNHLPPSTYLNLPRTSQKGKGKFTASKKTKRCGRRRGSQKGGLGPLAAMAGMTLAPMLLKPLLGALKQ